MLVCEQLIAAILNRFWVSTARRLIVGLLETSKIINTLICSNRSFKVYHRRKLQMASTILTKRSWSKSRGWLAFRVPSAICYLRWKPRRTSTIFLGILTLYPWQLKTRKVKRMRVRQRKRVNGLPNYNKTPNATFKSYPSSCRPTFSSNSTKSSALETFNRMTKLWPMSRNLLSAI